MMKLAILAVMIGTFTLRADAGVITITNYSFESPDVDDGDWADLTDWGGSEKKGTLDPQNGQFAGTTGNPGTDSIPGGTGHQCAFLTDHDSKERYIWQSVGTLEADSIYTLTAGIGERLDVDYAPVTMMLQARNGTLTTLVSRIIQSGEVTAGEFTDFELQFDSTSSTRVGEELIVKFVVGGEGTGNQGLVDNVRLTTQEAGGAIPEPAGIGLLGIGLLALRRRRA